MFHEFSNVATTSMKEIKNCWTRKSCIKVMYPNIIPRKATIRTRNPFNAYDFICFARTTQSLKCILQPNHIICVLIFTMLILCNRVQKHTNHCDLTCWRFLIVMVNDKTIYMHKWIAFGWLLLHYDCSPSNMQFGIIKLHIFHTE